MYIMRPYEASAIDGVSYCVKNGKFTRHLKKHNITAEDYCIIYKGMEKQLCPFCGNGCTFKRYTETYTDTCSAQDCINKQISIVKLNCSEYDIIKQNIKRQNTMQERYTIEERKNIVRNKIKNMRENGTYNTARDKRRQTNFDRYGNPTFNNPCSISASKLSWTKERKQEFLDKLHASLGGMTLVEYRDKFAKGWLIKRKETKVRKGLELPSNQIPAFVRYRRRVDYLTNVTYKKHKNIINPKKLPRVTATVGKQRGGYQVDHIISVKHGFINNIPPEIIADVSNLQMLSWLQNIRKGWK